MREARQDERVYSLIAACTATPALQAAHFRLRFFSRSFWPLPLTEAMRWSPPTSMATAAAITRPSAPNSRPSFASGCRPRGQSSSFTAQNRCCASRPQTSTAITAPKSSRPMDRGCSGSGRSVISSSGTSAPSSLRLPENSVLRAIARPRDERPLRHRSHTRRGQSMAHSRRTHMSPSRTPNTRSTRLTRALRPFRR
jgi:hypothetical protein